MSVFVAEALTPTAVLSVPLALLFPPTAVLLPPTRPASLVATLATILSLPTRAAGDLLVRLPQLLTVAPETLAGQRNPVGYRQPFQSSCVLPACKYAPT